MQALDPIFEAYEQGSPALLVTGRSIRDLDLDEEGKIRPLLEGLRRRSRGLGMHLITYSIAGGLEWDTGVTDESDRRTIGSALRTHHLIQGQQDQNDVVRVFRGIASLSRTPTTGLKWADGSDLRFVFLLEFAEHLTPGQIASGSATDQQIVAIELAHLVAQSLALRNSGNLIVFYGRDGLIDELVCSALRSIRLAQPDLSRKGRFLSAGMELYSKARLEEGLTIERAARLTVNTPNRPAEALIRASHRTGAAVKTAALIEQKVQEVQLLSENTLTVLDTERVTGLEFFGRNIQRPRMILEKYGAALAQGDPNMPSNVLLVGPPGTGKTDLAILAARQAQAPAYQMLSPKGGIVGETERKARLQQLILKEWTPNVAFCDEVTEALPLERSDFDGDSGASRAVTAALLTALSDESRRGRSLLVATTNCPWRMGAAMRSRFMMIPVLHPLRIDFPGIVLAIVRRIAPEVNISLDDSGVLKAAELFYVKGANPRHIRAALSNALLLHGKLSADAILFAGADLCASTDLGAAIYADLWAIKVCTSQSFLPWSGDPKYPLPDHLQGIVLENGEVDYALLEKRLKEHQAHANL